MRKFCLVKIHRYRKKSFEILMFFHGTENIFLTKKCLHHVAISKVIIKVNATNLQKIILREQEKVNKKISKKTEKWKISEYIFNISDCSCSMWL